jgi:plasmid stabilization system protein ParE
MGQALEMNFSFHPEAEIELIEAADYYEEREAGLGHDFAMEIYSTIERITAFPAAWPETDAGIRRCLVRRFPYGILYSEDRNTIFIVAIMHLHRKPDYWKHRI